MQRRAAHDGTRDGHRVAHIEPGQQVRRRVGALGHGVPALARRPAVAADDLGRAEAHRRVRMRVERVELGGELARQPRVVGVAARHQLDAGV